MLEIITLCVMSTVGGYDACGDIMSTVGGIQYRRDS